MKRASPFVYSAIMVSTAVIALWVFFGPSTVRQAPGRSGQPYPHSREFSSPYENRYENALRLYYRCIDEHHDKYYDPRKAEESCSGYLDVKDKEPGLSGQLYPEQESQKRSKPGEPDDLNSAGGLVRIEQPLSFYQHCLDKYLDKW